MPTPHISTPHITTPHVNTPHVTHPPTHVPPAAGTKPPKDSAKPITPDPPKPKPTPDAPAGTTKPTSPDAHPGTKPSTPDVPAKPNNGWGSTLAFGGIGLAGAGASIAMPFITAARDVGGAAVLANAANTAVHTVMDGVQNIVDDVTSNPMALGTIVVCVGLVAYVSMKK